MKYKSIEEFRIAVTPTEKEAAITELTATKRMEQRIANDKLPIVLSNPAQRKKDLRKKIRTINRAEKKAARANAKKLAVTIVTGAAVAPRKLPFQRNIMRSYIMQCGTAALPMMEALNKAVAEHDKANAVLFADTTNMEALAAEEASYKAVYAIIKQALEIIEANKPKKGGYELESRTWDAYVVKNGKTSVTTMYGACQMKDHADEVGDSRINVAFVYFKGECPEAVTVEGENELFVVTCSSNGGTKGHMTEDETQEGVAIAYRKSFKESWTDLNVDEPYTLVLGVPAINAGYTTIEDAQAAAKVARAAYEEAKAESDEASKTLELYIATHIAKATPKDLKGACDAADRKLAAAKAAYKATLGYVTFAANPACPKQVAAKNAQHGSFATTPSDYIDFNVEPTDHVVKQDDNMDKLPEGVKIVLKKPDGTQEESLYHFTGDDGGSTAPLHRVNKNRKKSKWLYTIQWRLSDLSGKGLLDVAEHIRLADAKKRFGEDITVGVYLSEDNTHNVYVWPDEQIFIEQYDGSMKEFHVGEDAIFSESTWKSKALDKGSAEVWLSRKGRMRAMRCEASVGLVRLGRQAIQILNQMSWEEAEEIAAIVIGQNAALAHPFFATEKVKDQIPAFKHPALSYMASCPGSQRQLNKTVWNSVTHAHEGRVIVEGAELPVFGDPNYRMDRCLGKTREESGKVKPDHILVPKSTGLKVGDTLWAIRYPLVCPRPVLLTVQDYCAEGRTEVSMMVGSTIMQDLAMDFDGDHLYLIWNKACISAAKRTKEWIDSFMSFQHFTADDIAAKDSIKYIPQHMFSTRALGLGDVGRETAPIFILQSVLRYGMEPEDVIIMPNGAKTTAKRVVELIFWICVVVTWEADASKRGASSGFAETAVGREIRNLVKGTYAPSQPYAKPYTHNMFGLLRGKDKLANKKRVMNDECPTEMIATLMSEMLRGITLPVEQAGRKDYVSYNSVMYGAYNADGSLTGGWVYRLTDMWASIFDKAEAAKINLAERWAVKTFTHGTEYDGEFYVYEPEDSKTYHIAPNTEVDGKTFREMLNENCGKALNWTPGWTTVVLENGETRAEKEPALSLALFVARKERAVAAETAKLDDDGGRKKTKAKEDAYAAAHKLIRAWAWEKLHRDLTDKECDEKLYMELGWALVGFASESTNMGASLQEWATYFSSEEDIVDSVSGNTYKRNFLTKKANDWWYAHRRGMTDAGIVNKEQAKKEMHITDVRYLHWLNSYDENDLYFYRDNDIDHTIHNAEQSDELDDVDTIMADDE